MEPRGSSQQSRSSSSRQVRSAIRNSLPRLDAYRAVQRRLGQAARVQGRPLDQVDPKEVAEKLDMHLNSAYRAKKQITRLLQEKRSALKDKD